jgi:hypothetical protein
MNTLRRLRNLWIPCVTTIVLGCFSDAVAQTSFKITDLGINNSRDNFSMAMGLNNQGWAENMDGTVNPPENNMGTTVSRGRAVISIYGFNIDLGTLGKTRRQQLDQLGWDQRPRGSCRDVRNSCV